MSNQLSVLVAALMVGVFSSGAHALVITPTTTGIVSGADLTPPTDNNNCEAGCVYDAFNLDIGDGVLSLYYKSDVLDDPELPNPPATSEGTDSGTFATSYKTTFSVTAYDPQNALIEYISGAIIDCPECYLAIKDGNHTPSYYFFNLGSWDGEEDISIQGFWPDGGAISHVSIWGREGDGDGGGGGGGNPAPEPGVLFLMGAGLLGLGMARRRKSA